jgi:hypothetical protein
MSQETDASHTDGVLMKIDWSFYLAAHSSAAYEKLMEKVKKAGVDIVVVKTEPYEKGKARMRVKGESHIPALSINEGYYSAMRQANRLARTWSVTVPEGDGNWMFTAASNPGSVRIQGIEAISFEAVSEP